MLVFESSVYVPQSQSVSDYIMVIGKQFEFSSTPFNYNLIICLFLANPDYPRTNNCNPDYSSTFLHTIAVHRKAFSQKSTQKIHKK